MARDPARSPEAWWLTEGAELSQSHAARKLGVSQPEVARRVKKIRQLRGRDAQIEGWMVALRESKER